MNHRPWIVRFATLLLAISATASIANPPPIRYELSVGDVFVRAAQAIHQIDGRYKASAQESAMTIIAGSEARDLINYAAMNSEQRQFVSQLLLRERAIAILAGNIFPKGSFVARDLVILPLPKNLPRPLGWENLDVFVLGSPRDGEQCRQAMFRSGYRGACGSCVEYAIECCDNEGCPSGGMCFSCPSQDGPAGFRDDSRARARTPIDVVDPRVLPLDLSTIAREWADENK